MSDCHDGGCTCGALRYRTRGEPAKTVVCHCRYCQLRSGSAFGVSVYFAADAVAVLQGSMSTYSFTTESGRRFTQHFCPTCATTVMWDLEMSPGLVGVAGGTFDPPSFWYEVKREVFTRTRAPFVSLHVTDSMDTSSAFAPALDPDCPEAAWRRGG